MIKYITYKVFNSIYFIFLRYKSFVKLGPTLFISRRISTCRSCLKRIIYFDTSFKTTHFGDRLFLVPLINALSSSSYDVITSDINLFTICTQLGAKISYKPLKEIDTETMRVILKPSVLAACDSRRTDFIIDFNDHSSTEVITKQVIKSFCDFFGFISEEEFAAYDYVSEIDDQVVYFSNYIDSGRFRKLFINESLLYRKCEEMKRIGYKIVHVGTLQDKESDDKTYDFVDVDLRGKTKVEDLMSILSKNSGAVIVAYDNFLMHLALIYKRKSYVLFRGRFFHSSYAHHMKFVNETFGKIQGYLN